jgi:hypothetical protein
VQQNGHITLFSYKQEEFVEKAEHLRRLASRMLLVAKRTKDPAIAESMSMQAGELLDQAQDLEAGPSPAHRDSDKSRN